MCPCTYVTCRAVRALGSRTQGRREPARLLSIVPLGNTAPGLRLRRALIVVAALVLTCGAAAPASAATRLVAPAGSDAGNCTNAPCASLGHAYAVARSGDVVRVAPGVYGEQRVRNGSKSVTFKGGPGVILRQMSSDANNVTYNGINVDAAGRKTTNSAFGVSGDNTTVKNARIGNLTDEKAMLATGANITIDNVLFHDAVLTSAGQDQDVHMECLYAIGVPGFTIRNSTFRDCAIMDILFTYGSWWSPKPPAYGNVTIENNVFSHPEDDAGTSWHYYGLYIGWIGPAEGGSPMSGWLVRNNTFENDVAIAPDRGTNGTRWVNNIGKWDCKPGIAYSHNVGKRCSGTDKAVKPASSTANRSAAAALGWVNPGLNDFRLRRSSPAINAGDPNDAPRLDREGLVRDSRPDAGAHEFGARPAGEFVPVTGQRRLFRRVRLSRHVICKRPGGRCAKVAKLRIAVRDPARVVVRVQRLKGGKRKLVRRIRTNVATRRTIKLRARGMKRGRYRIVVHATNTAGASSRPRGFKLRVRR